MNWYLGVLKKYAVFEGRARRKEYWLYALFTAIFAIAAMIVDNLIGTTAEGLPYGAVYFMTGLALWLPGLAITVRRLHDVGKSGWFVLIGLVPLLGIWLLVALCRDGDPTANAYGPNPRSDERPAEYQRNPAVLAPTTLSSEAAPGRVHFCSSCGSPNTAQGRFCASCGVSFT